MKSVLEKIKPSKKEELEVKKRVSEILKAVKINGAKLELGGSGAKGTWLKGSHDADIFVKFGGRFRGKDISKILEKALKKKFKISKLHGSRDYFQIKKKGFTFEFIPILDINKASSAENITDISPLHAKWVNKFKYKDDIRLMKKFCRANKCYGAESYIRGFSGYSLEILTIYYKGFNNFLKKASKWNDKVVIDPEKFLKNPKEELNVSKVQSPLILVDPVDKTRNVTAALSFEKFSLFRKACKEFLKKKSAKSFVEMEDVIPKKALVLKVVPKTGKRDVVGAKLLKGYEFLISKLKREGYNIVKSGWNFEKFWFVFSDEKLSKYKVLYGPPKKFKDDLAKFKKKHKRVYFDKRVYAKAERKYKDVKSFLRFLFRDETFKKRVKSVRII